MGRSRRQWLVTAGVALVLAWLTWRLWAGGTRGAEIANVLALPAAVVGALLAYLALRAPFGSNGYEGQLRATLEDLARAIERNESVALRQLLREVGDPTPANVTFDRLALVRWRDDGGATNGDLTGIGDYYRDLTRGRLVVLGEPGSGKTVLAVQLILDLLRARTTAAQTTTSSRVPVRFSLPAFNPLPSERSLEDLDDHTLAGRMDAWLATQLIELGVNRRHAAALVSRGWVLPVLDGLDEMDSDDAPPHRAAAVIRTLNANARPVVLTCRRHRYDQLASTPISGGAVSDARLPLTPAAALPTAHAVQDATTIMLDALTPATVRRYLTYLFPDSSNPDGIAQHWRATAHALDAASHDPAGEPQRPLAPLINALCSPWQLYLCRTAFADQGDPSAQLGHLAPDELTDDLLARLIPAAVAQHRRPGGQRYNPDRVTRWLSTLAQYLHRNGQQGGSSSDILLHELWQAAGPRAPRYLGALLSALPVALPAALIAALTVAYGHLPLTDPQTWYVVGIFAVPGVVTFGLALRKRVRLTRFDLGALATRPGRRRFLCGLAVGLVFGVTYGFIYGLAFGLAVGLTYGLGFGIAYGLRNTPVVISKPHELVRQGLASDLGLTFIFGLGFALGPSPWPRYFAALLMMRRHDRLPFRLARFLDWAYEAGLLRLSGIGIQFRHREFQNWLTNQSARSNR